MSEELNNEFVVIECTTKNFFVARKDVLIDYNLTTVDKLIYCLLSFLDSRQTLVNLSELAGVSEREARYSLKHLEELGLLRITYNSGKANNYELLEPKLSTTPAHSAPLHTVHPSCISNNNIELKKESLENNIDNKRYILKNYKPVITNPSKEFLLWFANLWSERVGNGHKYPIIWTKDTIIIKRLLGSYSMDNLKDFVERFFDSEDEFIRKSGYTIGVFSVVIPKLIAEVPIGGSKKNVELTRFIEQTRRDLTKPI